MCCENVEGVGLPHLTDPSTILACLVPSNKIPQEHIYVFWRAKVEGIIAKKNASKCIQKHFVL